MNLVELNGGFRVSDDRVGHQHQLRSAASALTLDDGDDGLRQPLDACTDLLPLVEAVDVHRLVRTKLGKVNAEGEPPRFAQSTTTLASLVSSRWSQTAVSSRTIAMLIRGRAKVMVAMSPDSSKWRVSYIVNLPV